MQGLGVAKGDASLKVKVMRKDGTVEELQGNPVEVNLPEQLVMEYKMITARAREIEQLLLDHMLKSGQLVQSENPTSE